MLVPIYHYIFKLEDSKKVKGIRPLWKDEFRYQIKWLINNYDIINPYEFTKELYSKNYVKLKKNKTCLITFDDGTKDQLNLASSILDEYNIKAIFFVLTDVLRNNTVPVSHILHSLLCTHEPEIIIEYLINNKVINTINKHEIIKNSEIYNYEKDINRRILKYLVNYELGKKNELIKKCLLEFSNKNSESEEDIRVKWFASKKDVLKVKSNGHMIGNHGVSHKSYESLSLQEIKTEINNSDKYLSNLLGENIQVFAHPQGGDSGKKNKYVATLLTAKNYCACFNAKSNDLDNPMDIGRIDAALLPPREGFAK